MSSSSKEPAQENGRVRINQLITRNATLLTASLFMVIGVSGVMMFFRLQRELVKPMHEWLGLLFVLAVVLHAVRNQRQFLALFAQMRMRILLVVVAAVAATFLALTPASKPNPSRAATQALLKTKLHDLAPVLGVSVEALLVRLNGAGATGASAEMSLEAIASQGSVDPMALLTAALAKDKKSGADAGR
jgi:hypothetical protein